MPRPRLASTQCWPDICKANSLTSSLPINIYYPNIPPLLQTQSLKNRVISQLKADHDPVAIANALNQENSHWEPIYITFKADSNSGVGEFYLYELQNEESELAWAQVTPLPLTDPNFLSSRINRISNELIGYGRDSKITDKIYLNTIHTKLDEARNFKYLGFLMIKAIEEFFHSYQSRIVLTAIGNSHGFYYKLGFRSADDSINQLLADTLQEGNGAKDTSNFGAVLMHLPDVARKAWQELPRLDQVARRALHQQPAFAA